MSANSYRLKLSLADQVRLQKLIAETGENESLLVTRLVHDFFAGRGVKNPLRKAKTLMKL